MCMRLTLNLTQGMYLTDSWYWDQNDETAQMGAPLFRQDEEDAVQRCRPPITPPPRNI